MKRARLTISGQVQGVGFRPFVFRLAKRLDLSGFVLNTPEGVEIEVQGPGVEKFQQALLRDLPPLARVTGCRQDELPPLDREQGFVILPSRTGSAQETLISPDTAMCQDCLADIRDRQNRRYRYPFTNCTNCGPRYTIIADLPYDRSQTTMHCFPLCPECAAEYADPGNRRFHAQPNACPKCGPQVWLVEDATKALQARTIKNFLPENANVRGDEAIKTLARHMALGKIAAIKGLGGFHLACDATSPGAVQRLRLAKHRPHKPLAVMVADLDAALQVAKLGPEEKTLLLSPERAIVLCPAKPGSALAPEIAPDTSYIGLMLPYTPLQSILLEHYAGMQQNNEKPAALVMTSGNQGGEPIALGNREALNNLGKTAEVFLLHNRDILIRNDDPVIRPIPQGGEYDRQSRDAQIMHLRRGRGYAPLPLPLPGGQAAKSSILALGAELKNTLCLTRGKEAFVSQHIGDLKNLAVINFQKELAWHLPRALQVEPSVCIADAHPDFVNLENVRWSALPRQTLQHHFAHAEAVLAENNITEPALALALDGTGYAGDGTIWGGELLYLDPSSNTHQRVGHLAHIRLPGGEASILEPWRIAHGLLTELRLPCLDMPWMAEHARTAQFIPAMLERSLNSPLTSSCGRLFDAVSALLGLCLQTTYEGQAAIRLETAQGEVNGNFYGQMRQDVASAPPVVGADPLVLDTRALFKHLYALLHAGYTASYIATVFHWSLAEGLANLALEGSRKTNTSLVGLSGGVMQNLSLYTLLKAKLRQRGLIPLSHKNLPANDGCIAYGQAVWGARQLS